VQAADKLARMNGVHAALQDGVNHACEVSGTSAYKLAKQPDYGTCYELYCKKSAARSSANNSDSVHLSMTADDLFQMCEELVASGSKEDMRNLAMILYQFATVSRGDDVRPRKLSELMVRYLKSVGESFSKLDVCFAFKGAFALSLRRNACDQAACGVAARRLYLAANVAPHATSAQYLFAFAVCTVLDPMDIIWCCRSYVSMDDTV
jgi:hypothetical protein